MANLAPEDWDITSPGNNDPREDGAREIRMLRASVALRQDREFSAAAPGGAGGRARAGCGRAYRGNAAPTHKPDGVLPLDANDNGRLWCQTGTNILKVYVYPNWVDVVANG